MDSSKAFKQLGLIHHITVEEVEESNNIQWADETRMIGSQYSVSTPFGKDKCIKLKNKKTKTKPEREMPQAKGSAEGRDDMSGMCKKSKMNIKGIKVKNKRNDQEIIQSNPSSQSQNQTREHTHKLKNIHEIYAR